MFGLIYQCLFWRKPMLSTLFLGVQQWAEALTMWTEYSTERLKQSSVMFALTFGTLK